MPSMKTNSPGGQATGNATPGLQSRDVVPDKTLAKQSNAPPTTKEIFGESPARADDAEQDNLANASQPTPSPNAK
jgi:hypothetical protein